MELTAIRTEGVGPLIIDRRACGGGVTGSRNQLIATRDFHIIYYIKDIRIVSHMRYSLACSRFSRQDDEIDATLSTNYVQIPAKVEVIWKVHFECEVATNHMPQPTSKRGERTR